MPDDIALRFTVQTPGDPEELRLKCLQNEARGLPEAAQRKSALILANGPSARHAASIAALRAANWGTVPIAACNGALSLCVELGVHPAWWICCDPQEDAVMRFVEGFEPPPGTTYLLANKSPPALFDKLLSKGLNVRIWRIDELIPTIGLLRVPTAVSVTLVAQSLLRLMGFHDFQMHGWDCCRLDGEHHATLQPDAGERIDYEMQNPDGSLAHSFELTGAWLAELSDAQKQAYNMRVMGYSMDVHGSGAVAATLKGAGLIA